MPLETTDQVGAGGYGVEASKTMHDDDEEVDENSEERDEVLEIEDA